MKSAVALTEEIDDPELAAVVLSAAIRRQLKFGKSTIGIVYCDADVAVGELGKRLHEILEIDIVGVTTTASLERHAGYHDMGIVFAVITGDDVAMAVGDTGELDKQAFDRQIRSAYDTARARLSEDPKLILLCAPYISDLTSENYIEVLDAVSGHVPVFGGVATDHYDLQYQKTFFNGKAYAGGLVFVLMSGNIRPVFAMTHHFGAKTERKGIITQSSGNQIERVGDQTFKDYLSAIMPVPEDELVIYHFQSTPFVMEMPDYESSEEPVVRALCTLNHQTGAGGFLSKMPEGSTLSINVLQRDDLRKSCRKTLDHLVEKMHAHPDYTYSLILISTCNARHLLMGDKKNLEMEIIIEKLSDLDPDLNAIGFYGFGEMCPTAISATGEAKNRFHNVSFALCAF
ncbi:FIST C-terminal domain-containing protein [Desulfosarcina sp. OttesenSCG-928-B08]|nr:FIST C-terminal domain-containing protein [Desulfosarcina sp. OttesenSCG-928-B08]